MIKITYSVELSTEEIKILGYFVLGQHEKIPHDLSSVKTLIDKYLIRAEYDYSSQVYNYYITRFGRNIYDKYLGEYCA